MILPTKSAICRDKESDMSTSNAKSYAYRAVNAHKAEDAARYFQSAVDEICKTINDLEDRLSRIEQRAP
jgi:hypothetical protein